MNRSAEYLYKEHAKTKAPDDFWGQVARTVNGVPVSQEQIDMIVRKISVELDLTPNGQDVLLDLGCGNGALSRYLFGDLRQFLGVDYSSYLIEVARQNFAKAPDFEFREEEALRYLREETSPERFNKVLCYGTFAYFPEAEDVLSELHARFKNVETVFIGNLPDKDLAHLYYPQNTDFASGLSDPQTSIGIWRTQAEFLQMADRAGWQLKVSRMPAEFFSAYYRYDITLVRKAA